MIFSSSNCSVDSVEINKKNGIMEKTGIDRNDQMVSYATTIRKSIKWYSKLALHLLLGTSIVNAHIVYQTATNKKIQIRKFREILVYQWCGASSENTVSDNHRKKRRRCPTIWRFVRISRIGL